MHTAPALVCALLGLVISPLMTRLVADPPLWEPSDEQGVRLEGRVLQVVTAVLSASLLGLAGWRLGWGLSLAPVLVLFAGLVVMSLVDLTVYRIPDRVLAPTYALSAVLIVVAALDAGVADAILWAFGCSLLAFGFMCIPELAMPGKGMGFGDVKLAALMGLFLGWRGWTSIQALDAVRLTLVGLLLGCFLGVVGGLPTAIRKGWRTHFPFGPALALATVVGVLWSTELLQR
jgi:leader peptidase (prepilin peptidase)/N-methyltransferase